MTAKVYLSKNQTFHKMTKHIDFRYHFIPDVVADGRVKIKKIRSTENVADAFTKSLPALKLESYLKALKVGTS